MRLCILISASFCALGLSMTAAQADPTLCTARINDRDVVMGYDSDEPRLGNTWSRRELLATKWGQHDCPSYVVLRSLTPELSDDERRPFCLRFDDETESVMGYDLGERDSWGRCRQPSASLCERVNQTRSAATSMTSAAARGTLAGLRALPDGSGAVILSGTGNAVSGALGSLGGAAATVAGTPALAAGAAVSVVAVGGAVYACRDRD
ncbi:MAG: hypothetical protein ACK4YU_00455 [Paracoccus sp. (in: a-proteobacteria)]